MSVQTALPMEELRLGEIGALRERHRVPVGLLDATDGGSAFALLAPALAAKGYVQKAPGRSLSTFRQPMTPVSLTIGQASSERVAARPST